MQVQRAIETAKREWATTRVSLEGYCDIGEFDSKNYVNDRFALMLIEMENKLPTHGYFTQEASYVFTSLASIAAERVGLKGGLAKTFGRGYSWIRTGWFDLEYMEEHHLVKQIIFFKIFFPLGRDFISWDFNSPAAKTKLKAILYKFAAWQSNPNSYIQDFRDYREQLEPLLYGLSLALDFPVTDSSKKY
jgi:hypothetical protein